MEQGNVIEWAMGQTIGRLGNIKRHPIKQKQNEINNVVQRDKDEVTAPFLRDF